MPQFGQNFAPAATEALHFGQVLAGGGARDCPQFGQNLAPAAVGLPHFGQGGPEGAWPAGPIAVPQDGQNRTPAGTIVEHLGQGEEGPVF